MSETLTFEVVEHSLDVLLPEFMEPASPDVRDDQTAGPPVPSQSRGSEPSDLTLEVVLHRVRDREPPIIRESAGLEVPDEPEEFGPRLRLVIAIDAPTLTVERDLADPPSPARVPIDRALSVTSPA